MAKNNKTAVEWLIDQLKGRYDIDIEKLTVGTILILRN